MMKRRKNKEENRDHQPYTKTTAIIQVIMTIALVVFCLLYTSDAADD